MASPGKVDRFRALRAARFFQPEKLRTDAWLSNFAPADAAAARELLERVIVVPGVAVTGMLRRIIARIVQASVSLDGNTSDIETAFKGCLQRLRFTPIDGEDPNPSDSGNFICRTLRQELRIPEHQILRPEQALKEAAAGAPLVLVDDFAGTGSQLIKHWTRKANDVPPHTLQDLANAGHQVTYCCPVVTQHAANRIQEKAPELTLEYAHLLGNDYRCAGPDAAKPLSPAAQALLLRLAPDLDIQNFIDSMHGYGRMALAIAFEHSVPDATLPIFWARSKTQATWVPLQERR